MTLGSKHFKVNKFEATAVWITKRCSIVPKPNIFSLPYLISLALLIIPSRSHQIMHSELSL